MARPKKIALLATGGTISTAKKSNGVFPSLDANELLAGINGYLPDIEVVPIDVSKMSSRNVAPADIWRLGLAIERCVELGYDGVVITHGTDTLEETVYGLSLLLKKAVPVVVTGAMISPTRPGSDGTSNLLDAVIVAADERMSIFGPVVLFQNEVFPARYVTKQSSTKTDAFASPFVGAIARVVEDRLVLFVSGLPFEDYLGSVPEPTLRVEIVLAYTGSDGRIIDLIGSEVDGLVIAGTGGGHVSEVMADALLRFVESGKPAILASRSYDGLILERTYGGIGSEIHLLQHGVLSAGDLSPVKARLKLLFGLQSGQAAQSLFSA